MSSDENIFELNPKWGHPLFSFEDEYKPAYRTRGKDKNKLISIGLTDSGFAGGFEAITHEFAHMIDIVLNNQHNRLLQVNFGMAFDKPYKNIEKIIDRELKVVAIQCRLFEMLDKNEDDIAFSMVEIINGFSAITCMAPHFTKMKSWDDKQKYIKQLVNKCLKLENELNTDEINAAIEDLHNFLDKHACREFKKNKGKRK